MTAEMDDRPPVAGLRYWIDIEGGGTCWVDSVGLQLQPDQVFAAAVSALSEFAREGSGSDGVWRAVVRTADGEVVVTASLEIRSSSATFAE